MLGAPVPAGARRHVSHDDVAAGPSARERHLAETVRLWLGAPAGSEGLPMLPESLARLLLREEETERSHRDQWGNWEHAYSENYRRGALWVPEVDRWVAEQRTRLAATTSLEPLWPRGARFALCLTHDVDMVARRWTIAQHLRSLALATAPVAAHGAPGSAERAAVAARGIGRAAKYGFSTAPDAGPTLERCQELQRERGVRGTYLFTVYPGRRRSVFDAVYAGGDACRYGGRRRRVRDVMRELADDGFDVGLHAGYCTYDDLEAFRQEKSAVEEYVGRPLVSCRQHYLHWDVARTPRIHAEAGILVDSSVGFNRNVGFRAGTALPHLLFDPVANEPLDVLELPLVVQESPLFAPNALELDEQSARRVVEGLLGEVAAAGGVATILMHPHSLLDPRQLRLYTWLLDHGAEQGGWIATMSEIRSWWDERTTRLSGGD